MRAGRGNTAGASFSARRKRPVILSAANNLALAVLMFAPLAAASELELFADAEAWGFAEPVPIFHYAEDWQAELDGGADGFLYQRYRLGLRTARYEFARISQRIYEVEPSRDTARLYHRVKNELGFAPGERFDLDLRVRHVAMHGIQFGRRFDVLEGRFTFTPALNLWRANSLLDGRIRGTAVAQTDSRFKYQLALDYFYTEDKLLDRRVDRPHGSGASLDLAARYQINAWYVRAEAQDLLGRLQWHDAPFTSGLAKSDNREFDADGFARFKPTFSGREGNRDFNQHLPVRALLGLGFLNPRFGLEGSVRSTPLEAFIGLAGLWRPWPDLLLGMELITPGPALGLRLAWKGFHIAYATDASSYKDSNYTSLTIGFNWSLPLRNELTER